MNHKFLSACIVAASAVFMIALTPFSTAYAATVSAAGEPYNTSVNSYPNATSATVNWSSDAPAVSSFDVERRVIGSRAWVRIASLPDGTRSFVDSGLYPQTGYEYRVRSYRSGGPAAGLLSVGTSVLTTPSANATPANYDAAAAPRHVDAQPLSSTVIVVTWQDVTPDETGFKIERRDNGGTWRAITTVPANTTLYRDTTTLASTTYEYRVSTNRATGNAIPAIAPAVVTPSASVRSIFFVDPVNGRDWKDGSEGAPWQTLQKANDTMTAGQTVLARNGTYTGIYAAIVTINKSGNAVNGYITYKNYPGEHPKLRSTKGKDYSSISVLNASYIIIDGFEIEGHLNDITQAEADLEYDNYKNKGISPTPITSSSGISIDGRNASKPPAHHVIVRNNIVYNHPLGGIGAMSADYITIENNRVFNNSALSALGGSNISFLGPKDFDSNTTSYKLIVRGNIVSDASNLYPCGCYSFKAPTDGNGIILDTFNSVGYKGKTLITNNIVYNNGGRGIHVFKSSNADIVYNTTVRNSTIAVTGDGEVTVIQAKNVNVSNNILVARTDRPPYSISFANAAAKTSDGPTINFDYNIIFGGTTPAPASATVGVVGTNNLVGVDPKFVSETGTNAYQLFANSPAVDAASNTIATPTEDAYRAPRPRGAKADIGAVESF